MLGSGCSHAACIPPASRHAWLMKTIHDTNHHCEGRFMPSEIGVFDTWCMSRPDTVHFIETWWSSMIWTMPLFLTNVTGTSFLNVEWFKSCHCMRARCAQHAGDQCVSLQWPPVDELPQIVGPDMLRWSDMSRDINWKTYCETSFKCSDIGLPVFEVQVGFWATAMCVWIQMEIQRHVPQPDRTR